MSWLRRYLPELSAVPLALLVLVVQVVGTTFAAHPEFGRPHGPPDERDWPGPDPGRDEMFNADRLPLDWLGYLLLVVGPLALVLRRRYPVGVAVTATGVTAGYLALGYPFGPAVIAAVIALAGAVLRGRRTAAWVTGWAGLACYLLLEFTVGPGRDPTYGGVFGLIAWLLVALLLSEWIRFRRERAAHAERAQEQRARQLADEERLRIARELHDVLAHNISMINIQAGVALHLADDLPPQASDALRAIKDASRDTLRELRATLGALRRVDEDAPRAPTPSLSRLDELISRTTAAGLTVRSETSGTPRPLPAGTDLAAYRIIQEALTNVHRHAGARTAWVRLRYAEDALEITVEDDGQGAGVGGDGAGSGIAGMRERATALGGSLETGRLITGGFRVRATLPLEPPADQLEPPAE